MLLQAIFDAFFALVQWGFDLVQAAMPVIPTLPDTSSYQSAASSVYQWAGWANWYVPVDQAVIAFGLVISLWTVLYGFRFLVWVLTKMHILGGQ